ncbi:MAG: FAD-dependent oxidoreductase, partial [Candidatus Bathyarchaeota archaeon]|nr:FAD-dependent oxidoreductase [Candidatus Bathyarchaeota archaeon]
MKRMGLFICHCGTNIADTVDVEELSKRFESYPGIEFSTTNKYMCSSPGQEMITDAIKEHNLDGIIVAACSPTLHELTFRKVTRKSGLNPYQCEIANVREQCSWVHKDKEKATEKALRIIRSIIEKVRLNEDLDPIEVDVTRKALVIGGGIAGMQAALDIAESGYPVILVEREPSIGGHMAQLSETFPTLDCSQCIMTPKMVEVSQHENIRLLTYSEIEEISGYVGNFKVKIRRKSPYVDWEKCNGCGECPEACPVRLRSEFDVGFVDRTAIYRPFPQAVPNKFTIEKRGTSPCKIACPAGVNAQGYVALVSQGKFKEALALEREDNPFPSVCGRVCTHPCESECKRGEVDKPVAIRAIKHFIADYEEEFPKPLLPKKKKKKVAIIGSGASGLSCAHYLAKLGYPTTVFESLPVAGGMLMTGIPDFRLPREKLQKDIDFIKSWGVEIKTNSLIKDPEILLKDGYSAVYIATGAHQERKLGIEGEDLKGVYYGIDFLRRVNLGEKVSVGEKVAVIGGGNSAVDSARTALRLGAKEVTIVYRRSKVEMPAYEEEIEEAEKEGIKINYLATPKRFIGRDGKLKQMKCIRMELGPPDESGRRRPVPIEGSEFLIDVDTVIPTIGQTPNTSYLPKDTNLKITEKWNSFIVDEDTLETSVPGIFAGGDAVLG